MCAKIRLDSRILDPIDVRNGLRQGCCMAPVLFNHFTSAVMERWLERAHEDDEEVGVRFLYKLDEKLFRRYTRNFNVRVLTECLFADVVSFSRNSAESAIRSFQEVKSAWLWTDGQ